MITCLVHAKGKQTSPLTESKGAMCTHISDQWSEGETKANPIFCGPPSATPPGIVVRTHKPA